MMDKQIILNGISLDQFFLQLDQRIEKKLKEIPKPTIQEEEEKLLDVSEVAKLLHTTKQNIHAKKRAGQIPFVRFGGRILFKKSEVIEALNSIRIQGK